MRYRHRLPRGRQQIRRLEAERLGAASQDLRFERPAASALHPRLRPDRSGAGRGCKNCAKLHGRARTELLRRHPQNPPGGVHGPISMGKVVNRVYLPYGVGKDGVIQIVDRQKLLNGCTIPTASPHCAESPTQADLLYPQVGVIAMNSENGGHSSMPVLGVPMPQEQAHFADGTPQRKNLLIVSSEDTANDCFGQAPHEAWILDITDEAAPWPIATLNVPPEPGDFCEKGARFGA